MPLISVIIPVYNVASYLRRCVDVCDGYLFFPSLPSHRGSRGKLSFVSSTSQMPVSLPPATAASTRPAANTSLSSIPTTGWS